MGKANQPECPGKFLLAPVCRELLSISILKIILTHGKISPYLNVLFVILVKPAVNYERNFMQLFMFQEGNYKLTFVNYLFLKKREKE